MHFSIVTPVFNGARFIDETILSIVTQAGPFAIRYHVQDGGSTDGTLEKLERWKARLAGDFPALCGRIEFTYASESDRGMYDAVNRGFAACGDGDVMSWSMPTTGMSRAPSLQQPGSLRASPTSTG